MLTRVFAPCYHVAVSESKTSKSKVTDSQCKTYLRVIAYEIDLNIKTVLREFNRLVVVKHRVILSDA